MVSGERRQRSRSTRAMAHTAASEGASRAHPRPSMSPIQTLSGHNTGAVKRQSCISSHPTPFSIALITRSLRGGVFMPSPSFALRARRKTMPKAPNHLE